MDTQAITGAAYLPRTVDGLVERTLQAAGGIVLEGPRGCGKTMTGLKHASSYSPEALAAADIDPRMLLAGERPRLLDEW